MKVVVKETLFIQELQPSLNANVGSGFFLSELFDANAVIIIMFTFFFVLQDHQLKCKRFPVNCPKNCRKVIPRNEVVKS